LINYSTKKLNATKDEIVKILELNKYKLDFPSSYEGNEMNSIVRPWNGNYKTRGVLCIPVMYMAGIANWGTGILYHMVNNTNDFYVERSYMPELRLYNFLCKNNVPVGFGVESKHPFSDFDWIGFSIYFELQFLNMISMLYDSGIPLYSKERLNDKSIPIVCLGGISAYSSEPVADIVDIVFIGDGESQIIEFNELLYKYKNSSMTKEEFFIEATNSITGVYIPSFYKYSFKQDNPRFIEKIEVIDRLKGKIPEKVTKALFDITKRPPFHKGVLSALEVNSPGYTSTEINRGCHNSCRFCMASACHKPYREQSLDVLVKYMKEAAKYLGSSVILPYGLNYSSYSQKNLLAEKLCSETTKSIVTATQRIDTFSSILSKVLVETGNRGATFAIEAGSQRLRNVVNKEISDEQINFALRTVIEQGYTRLKLYMISNLPFETSEDRMAIVEIFKPIIEYKNSLGKNTKIRISYTEFNAKPFTALQWADITDSTDKLELEGVYQKLTDLGIVYQRSISGPNHYFLQLLNRVDRRFCDALVDSVTNYGILFTDKVMMKGKDLVGHLDNMVKTYVDDSLTTVDFLREVPLDAILPWDNLSTGVSKEFLKNEYLAAKKASVTPSCMHACSKCGACFDPDMKKQGASVPLYHKKLVDIGDEELADRIMKIEKRLPVSKLLVSINIAPAYRYFPATKTKMFVKSAFALAGFNIQDTMISLSESCQFDNFSYGKELFIIKLLDNVNKITNSDIENINSRFNSNIRINDIKILGVKELTSVKSIVDYIVYKTVIFSKEDISSISKMIFIVNIRQKFLGNRKDSVAFNNIDAYVYKLKINKIHDNFYKILVALPININVYYLLKNLLNIDNSRDILKYPVERIMLVKETEAASLFGGKCECGNIIEWNEFSKPISNKCLECLLNEASL